MAQPLKARLTPKEWQMHASLYYYLYIHTPPPKKMFHEVKDLTQFDTVRPRSLD